MFRSQKYRVRAQKQTRSTSDAPIFYLLHDTPTERMFWYDWPNLSLQKQKELTLQVWDRDWQHLLIAYPTYPQAQKYRVLEALGYLHQAEIAEFLLHEMNNDDVQTQFLCCCALKKMDRALLIGPILKAIRQPTECIPGRIYEIVEHIGADIIPLLCNDLQKASGEGEVLLVRLLGMFDHTDALQTLCDLSHTPRYALRKAVAEALSNTANPLALARQCELLADPAWQIRLIAVQTLRKYQYLSAWNALQCAYEKETDSLLKTLFEQTLSEFGDQQIPHPQIWQRKKTSA